MSNYTYLKNRDNRSYLNESVVPFKGHYTDEQGIEQHRFMFVYVVHCIPTDQYYVGQHQCHQYLTDPLKDNYKGSGYRLKRLKKQYDWYKDFTFKIIEFCETPEQLCERERYWIQYYYNNHQSLNISVAYQVFLNNSAAIEVTSKPVICIETGERWESASACSRALGYKSMGSVMNLIGRGNRSEKTGYHYRYECDENYVIPDNKHLRKVINLNTGEVFESIKDANAKYPGSIVHSIQTHHKGGGYYWADYSKELEDPSIRQKLIEQYDQIAADNEVEHKAKFTNSARERCCRKIVCEEDGTEYIGVKSLAEHLGVHLTVVQNNCRLRKPINGKHYRYIEDGNKRTQKPSLTMYNLQTGEIVKDRIELAKRYDVDPTQITLRVQDQRPIGPNNEYWVDYRKIQLRGVEGVKQLIEYNQQCRDSYSSKVSHNIVCLQDNQTYTYKQLAEKYHTSLSRCSRYVFWQMPFDDGNVYKLLPYK